MIGILMLCFLGVYLVMVMLGFGEVVCVIVFNLEIIGGLMGLNGVLLIIEWWYIVLLLGVMIYVLVCLCCFKIGCVFEVIKEDEVVVCLMGVNVVGYKFLVFVIGVVIVGVVGGFNVYFIFIIGFNNYGFENVVDILIMVVFGGISNLIGLMIGLIIFLLLLEVLCYFKDFCLVINGLILILVVLYLFKGIWDLCCICVFLGCNVEKKVK